MYPISGTDFNVSFPYVGCICAGFSRALNRMASCCGKNQGGQEKDEEEEDSLYLALQNKRKQKEQATGTDDSNKDPYIRLGYGLIAYRNLLESLIIGFFFLSCLMLPAFEIYRQGDAFSAYDRTEWGKLSMGNLGYSSV